MCCSLVTEALLQPIATDSQSWVAGTLKPVVHISLAFSGAAMALPATAVKRDCNFWFMRM